MSQFYLVLIEVSCILYKLFGEIRIIFKFHVYISLSTSQCRVSLRVFKNSKKKNIAQFVHKKQRVVSIFLLAQRQ